MNTSSEKNAGIALIIFTVLLVLTMGLHPAGGGVEHLIRISKLIIITHSIAILSLPFGWVGFWGLTKKLGANKFWPMLSFAMITFGLFAVMIAASANGLIMPIFLQHYKDEIPQAIDSIKPVMRYSFAINGAFDYVYTWAFCLAIVGWSVTIIRTALLPKWIGWLGMVVAVTAVVIFTTGIAVHSLKGFRVFVGAVVLWIVVVGYVLLKGKNSERQKIKNISTRN